RRMSGVRVPQHPPRSCSCIAILRAFEALPLSMNRLNHADQMAKLRGMERMLRKTTECLANELVRPSEVAPDWSTSEWAIERAAATMHGISALLLERLRWQGPGDWTAFLTAQRAQILERHGRIQSLADAIDCAAREQGIALVALKGVALHARGIYRPGERP